jgi:hypothetical protein
MEEFYLQNHVVVRFFATLGPNALDEKHVTEVSSISERLASNGEKGIGISGR